MSKRIFAFLSVLLCTVSSVHADQWSGRSKAEGRYGSQPCEYQSAIVEQADPDGTLHLGDGKRLKVPELLLREGYLREGSVVLLYVKSGIPTLDAQGRIASAALVLADPVREMGTAGDFPSAQVSVRAASLVARMTLAPPAGQVFTRDSSRTPPDFAGKLILRSGAEIRLAKNPLQDEFVAKQRQLIILKRASL